MNKNTTILNLLSSLRDLANNLEALTVLIKEKGGFEDESTKNKEEVITKEMVKEKLYLLSQAGKSDQVKALLSKFGARKLTELAEEKYAEILKEAKYIN